MYNFKYLVGTYLSASCLLILSLSYQLIILKYDLFFNSNLGYII